MGSLKEEMYNKWMLARAIELATSAHKGQVDKGGNPYIEHPLRVKESVEGYEIKIIAVLHDIVEDTEVTLGDLGSRGFTEVIVEAVDALTRRSGETYMDFIKRCRENDRARLVKMKDIEDNKDLGRIENPSKEDYRRIKRYNKAEELLMEKGIGRN